MPSARDAAYAMVMSPQERAAYNDAAVKAAGGGWTTNMAGFGDPGDRQAYEGKKAVERRRKLVSAGIDPREEIALANMMEHSGSKSMWNYGPGFQQYRARAAIDALAAAREREGGDPRAKLNRGAWGL